MARDTSQRPITVTRLQRMKADGQAIACLTAYDYSFARLADAAGIDVLLVGDTLGMVIQGLGTTLPVDVDDIVYHTRCVAAGAGHSLVMADLPFLSYSDPALALASAARLMKEGGARMVKLEGAGEQAPVVRALASAGVPVCAHLGLQPQRVHKIGGYRIQGREAADAEAMIDDASTLERAGADVLLLECVPAALAERITAAVGIPVIGIGAGAGCDGQILVLQDMLGITPGRPPSFSRDFMATASSIRGALEGYAEAVRSRQFPSAEHAF